MDSLATLNVPAIGYGIRYEFGIFDQAIRDGWQVELTDKWLRFGNPCEIVSSEVNYNVKFGGVPLYDGWPLSGALVPEKAAERRHDSVPGYNAQHDLAEGGGRKVLRFRRFNIGVTMRRDEKTIKPSPRFFIPMTARWKQPRRYFFVSCSLQDMIRLHLMRGKKLDEFHLYWAAQLNDTHPSIAVPELRRLLVDEHLMDWDRGRSRKNLRLHESHASSRR
jgi:starch phosphorylase